MIATTAKVYAYSQSPFDIMALRRMVADQLQQATTSAFEGAQDTQPVRSKIMTGIWRVVCRWYSAKNGISAACAL
jgi:hypothetical protein